MSSSIAVPCPDLADSLYDEFGIVVDLSPSGVLGISFGLSEFNAAQRAEIADHVLASLTEHARERVAAAILRLPSSGGAE